MQITFMTRFCTGEDGAGLLMTSSVRHELKQLLRVMRITAFFLLAVSIHLSARTLSQTVTFHGHDVPVQNIFTAIEKQTGLNFAYDAALLRNAPSVNLDAEASPLVKVLADLSKQQPFDFQISQSTIFLIPKKTPEIQKEISFLPPPATIHGRVTDSLGNPLIGATVQVKGSKQIAVTDKDGQFVMSNVPEDAILIVSFVGYSQMQIQTKGKSDFDVHLYAVATELENVEVALNNGYQKIPKERATGSFDFIDNKKFNEQVSANVLDRLEGIASGLSIDRSNTNPNSNLHKTQISIRGLSTINGERDPLIVVDNFPYDGDLSNLNPNNVENITILKDAAAASIWGAKAGNGVIVITTKKGKFGQKMKVTANANMSITDKPDLFSLKIVNAPDIVDFEKNLFDHGYYDYSEQNKYDRPALSPVVEVLIAQRDQLLSDNEAQRKLDSIKNHDVRNDFDKYMYRKAVHKQASVNITGGTNNVAYNLFAGCDKDISNLYAGSQRINLGSVNTFKPLKNVDITASVQFTEGDNSSGRTGYNDARAYGYNSLPLYTRLADDKGNALPIYTYRQPFIDTLGGGKLLDWRLYPLDDWKYNATKSTQTDFIVNTSLGYQLLPSLRLSFDYKYEKQQSNSSTLQDQQSYFVRDRINTFTQLPADGSAPIYIFPLGDVKSTQGTELSSNQLRGQLSFYQSWHKHMLSVLAAGETSSTATESNSGNLVAGFNPDNLTNIPIDIVNYYPSSINGGITPLRVGFVSFSQQTQRFVSALANASYTYNRKYTLTASARRDGANIFGATTNNKWKPLWSVGALWDLSRENFYKSYAIPSLKLRATYGYQGNVVPGEVGVITISSNSIDYYQARPRYSITSYNNPNLRWEKIGMVNLGLDFSMHKNIVSGSLEYYHKKTSDLFGPSLVDYTTIPAYQIFKNVASTVGNGVDIHLITKNLDRKIKWSTTLNASWYKDRVLSYNDQNKYTARGLLRSFISPKGHHSVYGIYSLKWAGLNPETGDPQGYLGGKVSTNYSGMLNDSAGAARYNGSAFPTFYGSIGNAIEWNRLSLSVNILYRLGYYFRRTSINYSDFPLAMTGSSDFYNRWMKPGDEAHTNVPSFVMNNGNRDLFYSGSDALIEKGDQVRLNYIQLNYTLNPLWIEKIGITSLNVYANASNLGIIWRANKDGIDPDFPNNVQTYKTPKTISFGLNASF